MSDDGGIIDFAKAREERATAAAEKAAEEEPGGNFFVLETPMVGVLEDDSFPIAIHLGLSDLTGICMTIDTARELAAMLEAAIGHAPPAEPSA